MSEVIATRTLRIRYASSSSGVDPRTRHCGYDPELQFDWTPITYTVALAHHGELIVGERRQDQGCRVFGCAA
jgi:hypothetical protein